MKISTFSLVLTSEEENCCLLFTSSLNEREAWKFHVAVVQQLLKNEQK